MDPYAIDFLLKLGIFDSPEEILNFLKKKKLVYVGKLPGTGGATIPPGMATVRPIGKWFIKQYIKLFPRKNPVEKEIKKFMRMLSFVERIGKRTKKLKLPALIVEEMPGGLSKLPLDKRLAILHELSHAGRYLRHPVLRRPLIAHLSRRFMLPRLIEEYIAHREALKWLKKPLPKKYPLVLRSPLVQSLMHLRPVKILYWLLTRR